MANATWGIKRVCPSCGARYYDLNKTEIVCPKCDTPWSAGKTRTSSLQASARAAPAPRKAKPAVVAETGEEIELEIEDAEIEDEEEDIIEDTDDLGEDDEDMAEVIDKIDDDVGEKS